MSDAGTPRLTVTGGAIDGTCLEFREPGEKLLGTGPDCHLRVSASHLEAVHARVAWDGSALLLSDAGSVAGTYVNGEKVGEGRPLQDGDRICLGPPGFKASLKLLVSLAPAGPGTEAEHGEVPAFELALPAVGAEGGEEVPAFSFAEPEPAAYDAAPFEPPTAGPAAGPAADAFPLPEAGSAGPFGLESGAAPGAADETWLPPPEPAEAPTAAPLFEEAGIEGLAEPAAAPPPPAPPAPLAVPTPAPVPAPARPAAAPAPPARPKPAPRPEYTDGIFIPVEPRSVPVESAVPPPVPAAPPPAAPRLPLSARVALSPRILALWGGVLVLFAAGAFGYRLLFPPRPAVQAVAPARTKPGQAVTLTGTGFARQPEANTVRFGETAGTVTAATSTSLTVTVPDLVAPEPKAWPVTVETRGGRSGPVELTVYRAPKVTGLHPEAALPGGELEIRGESLSTSPVAVRFGQVEAEVREARPDRLRVVVPALTAAEGESVPVLVEAGGEKASPASLLVGRLPLVTAIEPRVGLPNSQVTVRGRGFSSDPGSNLVTFAGVRALVLSTSPGQVVVAAPALEARGTLRAPVVVTTPDGTSSGSLAFELSGPGGSAFFPRFWAAPVPDHPGHDHAFVSTELGPVLMLTGGAGGGGAPERAWKVAEALGRAFADEKTVFELRDGTAVFVAGQASPLVTVTAEDVAGYAEPGVGGRALAPAALGAHWLALLQDYHGLFVRHERPTRLAETTARARALLDIHSDAARKGGRGAPVPLTSVFPPTPALRKAVQDLALLPPEGRGADAVISGQWEGRGEEEGAPRRFDLTLRVEGGRLRGTFKSQQGGIAAALPIQDASFDKGVLSFSVRSGRELHRFRGTLAGDTVTGVITTVDRGREIGQFTLRFVE